VAFEWDDDNVGHIAEHGVTPDEAEEVFADPRRRGLPAYDTLPERRLGVIGETYDGRLLVVIYTHRNRLIRVITVRRPDPTERRKYRRKK
jgi:uncharacterized DUF497 family protein